MSSGWPLSLALFEDPRIMVHLPQDLLALSVVLAGALEAVEMMNQVSFDDLVVGDEADEKGGE